LAIGSAGVPVTLVTIFVIMFFWSLPQAFMSAELSLMMNANGGNILWVQNAFGEWIGLFNAWCFLTSCIVSQALLIYSYLQYLQLFFVFSPVIRWVLGIIFVAISFLVNIWGINYLSRLSWVMFGLIFLPFIMINFYIPFGHPPKDINWSVLISTVVWNLEGYDSLGSVAGEVKGGKKVFIAGIHFL